MQLKICLFILGGIKIDWLIDWLKLETSENLIVEIDETLNAVELKKAGNIISLSNSNSFTESLGIGKANCRKLILRNS